MTQKQVEKILDLTRSDWREKFAAEKFRTFNALVEAIGEAVEDGCKQLGLEVSTIH